MNDGKTKMHPSDTIDGIEQLRLKNRTRSAIKEGFYFQEKPLFGGGGGIFAPANSVLSRINRGRKTQERYLVLRRSDQHEIPNREEPLDIIEVYEGEQDWANQRSYKPLKKGVHYQQSFLLEDLYYVHTMDVDPIHVRKDNSLYYQCVLYFRSEVVRKVEMWFKKDDREKRTEWIAQITRVRNDIAELKAKGIGLAGPFFPKPRDLYPEVEYVGYRFTNEIKEQTSQQQKALDSDVRAKTQLHEKEHYHLRFSEFKGEHPAPKFKMLQQNALRYTIEFIDIRTANTVYSLNHTDIKRIGYDDRSDFSKPRKSHERVNTYLQVKSTDNFLLLFVYIHMYYKL